MTVDPVTYAMLATLAFVTQYISGVIGMGYGTILTPVLILLGVDPLNAVSSIVISQLVGNSLLALLHHRAGNADFRVRSPDLRKALLLGLSGVFGPIIAVFLLLKVPKEVLKIYIAFLMILMVILTKISGKFRLKYSVRRLFVIALLASFNKGLTGGGYGPIVTTGQLMLGLIPKSAIAITSLAEFLTEVTAVSLYAVAGLLKPTLFIPMVLGTLASAPLVARTVRVASNNALRRSVMTGAAAIAVAILVKAFLPAT